MTVGQALEEATRYLTQKKLPFSRRDAELLLAHALGSDRVFLFAHPEAALSSQQEKIFRKLLKQRGRHYPIQYLRGVQEFYNREFLVDPAVLIPRPETEIVVAAVLEVVGRFKRSPLSVLDVGSGSGCIAVTLACEIPGARVTALDISARALAVARGNARRHGCLERVEFLVADALSSLAPCARYDVVVSNPPYVDCENREAVARSVRHYEPEQALFSRERGLELYGKLFRQSASVLKPTGRLVVELGYALQPQVEQLAHRHGWAEESLHEDLARIPRCAVFRRL